MTTRRYWDIPLPDARIELSEADCCEQLRSLAGRAVKQRLISDVPLGVFLSGGLDSSAVVALMAEAVPAREIQTFTIGFKEASYDESSYARLVAQVFGTNHYEEILSATQAGELLPDIVGRLDEPMADPSIVPTYLLSEVTRRRVTVALGGDGGDELFGGYEIFPGLSAGGAVSEDSGRSSGKPCWSPWRACCPSPAVMSVPGTWWPSSSRGSTPPAGCAPRSGWGRWLRTCKRSLWQAPLPEALRADNLYAETRALYEGYPAAEPINRVFYLFARQYLLDYILVKVDRCSMMHALEVRAPFLDTALMEFVYRLPYRMKIRHGKRKYLLKKAFKDILPRPSWAARNGAS